MWPFVERRIATTVRVQAGELECLRYILKLIIKYVCVYGYLLDIRWTLDDRPQCYNCSDLDVFMSEIMTKYLLLCKPVK